METVVKKDSGYLEIIIGSMFSGKTSRLLTIKRMYDICNIQCHVINFVEDNRYHSTMLSTHDKCLISCINVKKLKDALTEQIIKKYDIFLINEGQFFCDLFEEVEKLVNVHNKKVYVCGLDSDYQLKKFGQILDLIPICDNVIKQHALCIECKNGTKAIFSKRLSKEKKQKMIGIDNYIPVCRKCYLKTI